MPLLEVHGLTKRFAGLTALDGVTFSLQKREILGLFGPNGAGKTTCFHCLSGFVPPDAGRIVFDGRDITGYASHRVAQLGIGRTFQVVKLGVTGPASGATSGACTRSSRGSASVPASWPRPSPVASSRCAPSGAPSWPRPASS